MKIAKFNIPGDRGKLYEVIKYPAGEIQVRLTVEGIFACTGKDIYEIKANPIPDIVELAQLKSAIDGVQKWVRRELDLPYLPYARADRRFVPGDSHGLHTFATLINALNFDVVYTFDVHNEWAAVSSISNLLNLNPISHDNQIVPAIKYMKRKGLVLIAPDKGAAERYDLGQFKLPVLTAEKLRDAKTGKLSGFSISDSVSNYRSALIVDDICDGGGTFIGLADVIKEAAPHIKLGLYVSHGIFSKGMKELNQRFGNLVFISNYSFRSQIVIEDFTEAI